MFLSQFADVLQVEADGSGVRRWNFLPEMTSTDVLLSAFNGAVLRFARRPIFALDVK